jgi:putative CocE/NonD family hydrolase
MAFNVRNNNPKALTEVLTGDGLPFTVKKVHNIRIPLTNGDYIHAHAWFPDSAIEDKVHSFGALVEYIPYRTDVTVIRDSIRHPFYAANGFVSIRVDMRGSCNSSGVLTDEYLQQEQDDAMEVFDWIVNQTWSNGNIAMFGKSWGGFNGLQVAARNHPALKTIITLMSTDDRYSDDVHYRGGCLLASDMVWWGSTMLVYQPRPQDPRVVGEAWKKNWLKRLEVPPMLVNWIKHQTRDDYWKHGSVCENWEELKIPVLAIGGFRDGYTNPVFRMAEKLSNPSSACIVGPWVHEYPEMAEPAPKIDYQQISVKWFSKWLYPERESGLSLPRLTVYIQDPSSIKDSYVYRNGRWVSTDEPKVEKSLSYHLNGDNMKLETTDTTAVSKSDHQPVTFSGTLSHGIFRGTYCPFGFRGDFPGDQKNEDSKCTCFDSEILNEEIDLVGLPYIYLELSSNEKLANISVRLVDIYPNNGEHVLLSWGQLNLTHRDSHEFPSYLVPDQKYKVRVQLDAVGIKLAKGHKLRVALSPCDWPQAWPTPEIPILTVYSGELVLPKVNKETAVQPPEFGTPTIMKQDITLDTKRAYDRTKKIDYDYGADVWTLTDIQDGGKTEINNNGELSGFYFGEYNKNVWQIEPSNPLSSMNKCSWVYEMGRVADDWNIRFESESTLTSDTGNFYLINKLKALENDKVISEREYHDTVPRNFL